MAGWWLYSIELGVGGGLIAAGSIVGCFEKHPVRMFEPIAGSSFGAYTTAMVASAIQSGFTIRAAGRHTKFREKLPGALLLSPDHSTLLIVADGMIIGMHMKKMILLSRCRNGQVLVTVDRYGSGELDPMSTRQYVLNAGVDELYRRHAERLAELPPVIPFPENASWKDVDNVYRGRSDRIVAAGLAHYVDPEHEYFRYTPWGSFRAGIVHSIGQLLKPSNYLRQFKRQV